MAAPGAPPDERATITLGFLLNDPRCHLRVYDRVSRVVLDVYLDKSRIGDLLAGLHGIPARMRRWPAAETLIEDVGAD
jgi:hypothetical protein